MMEQNDLGRIVVTNGVHEKMKQDRSFRLFVQFSLGRFMEYDWGEMAEEDKKQNDEAVKDGERIFASYEHGNEKIWIITERDRSATTILFPEEY